MPTFRSVLAPTAVAAALVVTATSAAPAIASGHSILREHFVGTFPLTDLGQPQPHHRGREPGWGDLGAGRGQPGPRA